jgi:hypothetical protein
MIMFLTGSMKFPTCSIDHVHLSKISRVLETAWCLQCWRMYPVVLVFCPHLELQDAADEGVVWFSICTWFSGAVGLKGCAGSRVWGF